MSKKIKISVVITCHNYAHFIEEAINSVLAQSLQCFEVVVIDDGSEDNIDEVISKYKNVTYLSYYKLKGVGLAAASNFAIKKASGDYIIRLDADDWFDDNILLILSNYLDNHNDIGMVFCDYYTVDIKGKILHQHIREKISENSTFLLDRPALAAGAMYRKSCWDAVGGYNENLRFQEDYDFWIKFIEKFEVRNINLPLMFYRQHGMSMSNNINKKFHAKK